MRRLVLGLVLTVGCVVPDAEISGKPCPCPSSTHRCDESTMTCVPASSTDVTAGGGGSGAAGSSSGASTCQGLCGTPGCGACPSAPMVEAGAFLVDALEASNQDYATFLADTVDPASQGSACSWNLSFAPIEDDVEAGCLAPYDWSKTEFPIVCVDWCDAAAFCAWAGKRLCGRAGGGTVDIDDVNDASQSQWFAACSAGGVLAFPYGDVVDDARCNTSGDVGAAVGTGWFTDCEGGYPGLFNMVGNVEEWEDACETSADPATDNCLLRGGAFWADDHTPEADHARCVSNNMRRPDRNRASHDWGFRCCKDP